MKQISATCGIQSFETPKVMGGRTDLFAEPSSSRVMLVSGHEWLKPLFVSRAFAKQIRHRGEGFWNRRSSISTFPPEI